MSRHSFPLAGSIFLARAFQFRWCARPSAGISMMVVLVLGATASALPAASVPTEPVGSGPWSLHTQATYIDQFHFQFPSEYSGPNSLVARREIEHTFSCSLFLGHKLWDGAELFYDPEIFQGHGLSSTLGVAGFPNGEAVKSGFANLHYNTSRLFVRQTIGLGGEKEKIEDDANQFPAEPDVNRVVISVGKFSANDFFDGNAYSHDPRLQFLNWAMWETVAWDYPADVVGFTSGAVVEWNTRNTTLHYGLFMEPSVSNGARLDNHLATAHAQMLQFDYRYTWHGHHGTVRPFVFWNQAHMGLYQTASVQPYPADITATRAYRSKVGFGVSWDQALTENLGAFLRLGANDGRTESWAFTEVDRSVAAGLSWQGQAWNRPADTAGLAAAINGISPEHRRYLANGGTGLILGDGALHYGPEQIAEFYYNAKIVSWFALTLDVQFIERPGYNRDRGHVAVYAVRTHIEF